MGPSGTAVGYSITATIWDLELTSTGTDAGINHPITYYKDLSGTSLWTTMTTLAILFLLGKKLLLLLLELIQYTWQLITKSITLLLAMQVGTWVIPIQLELE